MMDRSSDMNADGTTKTFDLPVATQMTTGGVVEVPRDLVDHMVREIEIALGLVEEVGTIEIEAIASIADLTVVADSVKVNDDKLAEEDRLLRTREPGEEVTPETTTAVDSLVVDHHLLAVTRVETLVQVMTEEDRRLNRSE